MDERTVNQALSDFTRNVLRPNEIAPSRDPAADDLAKALELTTNSPRCTGGLVSWIDVAARRNELDQSHYRASVFAHTGTHADKRGVPSREGRGSR